MVEYGQKSTRGYPGSGRSDLNLDPIRSDRSADGNKRWSKNLDDIVPKTSFQYNIAFWIALNAPAMKTKYKNAKIEATQAIA